MKNITWFILSCTAFLKIKVRSQTKISCTLNFGTEQYHSTNCLQSSLQLTTLILTLTHIAMYYCHNKLHSLCCLGKATNDTACCYGTQKFVCIKEPKSVIKNKHICIISTIISLSQIFLHFSIAVFYCKCLTLNNIVNLNSRQTLCCCPTVLVP